MYLMSSKLFRIGSKSSLTPLFADSSKVSVRNLFSREELGITGIERLQLDALRNFKSNEHVEIHKKKFIESFSEQLLHEKRDNLKEYILLVNRPGELTTLKSLLVDYHSAYNSTDHRVKPFTFGTEIMRMLHLLNLPDEAVKFYEDTDLENVFEQMQTYKVMLNLLYENKRFAEVFRMYDQIRQRLHPKNLFPDITLNCLAFGACYHLNTPDHFKYAENLWQRTQNVKQLTRSRYFLAALAIKQNQPQVALNLVSTASLYVTVRFIQLMAYTQMGRFDRACHILSRTIDSYRSNAFVKPKCGHQMIEDLRVAIKASGNEVQLKQFSRIYEELKSLDLINDETLDQYLCATFPPMLPKNAHRKMKAASGTT